MAVLGMAAAPALAQDSGKIDPKHHKVEFENDQVRVLRVRVGPHETVPVHEHPANIVIWATDARLRITSPNGKPEERSKAS